jgi:hypothetical protein
MMKNWTSLQEISNDEASAAPEAAMRQDSLSRHVSEEAKAVKRHDIIPNVLKVAAAAVEECYGAIPTPLKRSMAPVTGASIQCHDTPGQHF